MEIKENQKIKNDKNLQLKLLFFRYNRIITLTLITAIVSLSYYFVLGPKYQEVRVGGRYNIDSLQQELNKRKLYLADLNSLNNNYKAISSEDIEKIKMILPQEKDIAGLFSQFEYLASQQGLFLSGVSINETEVETKKSQQDTKGKVNKLNVTLSLISTNQAGDYEEIKDFLSVLEYNLRLFDVNSVYFSPDSPNYSVNLFTYYYQK